MPARRPLLILALILLAGLAPAPAAGQAQMTWAVHISLAPVWFDPAEHTGIITVMKVLYAVHDAMVKPMPAAFACSASAMTRGANSPMTRRACANS